MSATPTMRGTVRWQPSRILRTVPQDIPSSTAPRYVVTDLGNGFLKMPQNPQGPSALISELFGTMLAEWFGLPTFQYAIMQASQADIDANSDDEATVPAFISLEEPGETWQGTVQELAKLENAEVLSRLIVFDTWIGNFDRYCVRERKGELVPHANERNLFLSHNAVKGKLKAIAYDHTHCQFALISASPEVEIEGKIEDPGVYGNFPAFGKRVKRNLVRQAAEKLGQIDLLTLSTLVTTIPTEWFIDERVRGKLVDFAFLRADFVSSTIEQRLFPPISDSRT